MAGHVTLNRAKEVTGAFSGTLFESHALGCNFAKQAAMLAVPEPLDVVVTTNSGYRLDQNLYQTVKIGIIRDGPQAIPYLLSE